MNKIRIASRKSQLALYQSNFVGSKLQEKFGIPYEIVNVVTTGDKVQDKSLIDVGGKGLFIKEVEHELLVGNADIAVHSLKDVPAEEVDQLVIPCFPSIAEKADCLLSTKYKSFDELPKGAIVGTSSPRREYIIRQLRPDIEIKLLRGNVDTRIDKLVRGDYDAIILAAAGLHRLEKKEYVVQYFDTSKFYHAMCQGIIGVQCRKDAPEIVKMLGEINLKEAQYRADVERNVLKLLNGDCHSPIGCNFDLVGNTLKFDCFYSDAPQNKAKYGHVEVDITKSSAMDVALAVAKQIL